MYQAIEERVRLIEEQVVFYGIVEQPKFLVDAQLPKRLSAFIASCGFDTIHTLDLPDKNATSDNDLKTISIIDNRVLITKDDDFLQSFLIEKKPAKLILIRTGNIHNKDLIAIFEAAISVLVKMISSHSLIEITRTEIITHE